MKIYIKIILLFILNVDWLYAQQSLKLSLKEAQELGLTSRLDVKSGQKEIAFLGQDVLTKKQAFAPDVKLVANIMYHPQVQSTLIPAGFGGLAEPAILALGAKSISVFSLEIKQPLFNPALKVDVKIAETIRSKEEEQQRQNILSIKQQINESYLNVLLRQTQKQIATYQKQRFEEYQNLVQGKYHQGAALENDFLRVQLDLHHKQEQYLASQNDYELSLVALCFELNIPTTTNLILSDSLSENSLPEVYADDSLYFENLTAFRKLALEKKRLSLEAKRQEQSLVPEINLVGNYSQQYLNMAFNYNYTDGKWWSPYSYLGIQMGIPITKQFTNSSQIKKIQLKNELLDFQILQEKNRVSFELRKAKIELKNALQSLKSNQQSYLLAQKIYQNQKNQMFIGTLSYDDLLNTELSVSTTEQHYINALHHYYLVRLVLDGITENL
jgi:outer membrane protein TolC